jgi:structural protein KPP10_ORF10
MSQTYSFKDVSASINGPTGSANLGYGAAIADEGITIDMAGDKETMHIGADGTPMHSLHADKSGTVTVRCLKTSPTNAILQAMYDAQQVSSTLWAQNVIIVRENESGDITTCSSVGFKKKANLKYGKEADIVEWPFNAGQIDTVLGTY